jgi:hypothetical protein
MGFLDFASQYKVKENAAVNEFSNVIKKQLKALESGKLSRRSLVKPEGNGYLITLGKLPGVYTLPDKEEAVMFLQEAISSARTDEEFIEAIEKAYGGATEDKPKRARKARTPKAEG